ncbi:MAG TPA: hypothetical protein VJI75_03190 [Candidatus Nanoarchaeia archaeon]|nr:hypothetical protein [Candidatus Nanoarchaeia archaeon]
MRLHILILMVGILALSSCGPLGQAGGYTSTDLADSFGQYSKPFSSTQTFFELISATEADNRITVNYRVQNVDLSYITFRVIKNSGEFTFVNLDLTTRISTVSAWSTVQSPIEKSFVLSSASDYKDSEGNIRVLAYLCNIDSAGAQKCGCEINGQGCDNNRKKWMVQRVRVSGSAAQSPVIPPIGVPAGVTPPLCNLDNICQDAEKNIYKQNLASSYCSDCYTCSQSVVFLDRKVILHPKINNIPELTFKAECREDSIISYSCDFPNPRSNSFDYTFFSPYSRCTPPYSCITNDNTGVAHCDRDHSAGNMFFTCDDEDYYNNPSSPNKLKIRLSTAQSPVVHWDACDNSIDVELYCRHSQGYYNSLEEAERDMKGTYNITCTSGCNLNHGGCKGSTQHGYCGFIQSKIPIVIYHPSSDSTRLYYPSNAIFINSPAGPGDFCAPSTGNKACHDAHDQKSSIPASCKTVWSKYKDSIGSGGVWREDLSTTACSSVHSQDTEKVYIAVCG